MPIAILDPFSGISGDMTLGALVDVGLDATWLRALPERLGLTNIGVHVSRVRRAGIVSTKVDFDIPPQPHSRGMPEIRGLLSGVELPERVRQQVDATFMAIATAEAEIHGVAVEHVHLHEVGAVDAILDVVGSIWGLAELGVTSVYCGPIALGEGTVAAAHGELPVPAPATYKLLEGLPVRPGPAGAGELVTPTGAALVRVLSKGLPPITFVPRRSGFGAGTKDPAGRPNALRIILADPTGEAMMGAVGVVEELVMLSTDIDDLDGESTSAASDALRRGGALDVVLLPTMMKKGRPGTRIDVLCLRRDADQLEDVLLSETTTNGVRRVAVERRALPRREVTVEVDGHSVRVKVTILPQGGLRAKPEFDDIARVATATGRSHREVAEAARRAADQEMGASAFTPAGRRPPDF